MHFKDSCFEAMQEDSVVWVDGMLNRPQRCSSKESIHQSCISARLYLSGPQYCVCMALPLLWLQLDLSVLMNWKKSLVLLREPSSVGIATGYGVDGREVGVRIPIGVRFSPLPVSQTGAGAHPASYPVFIGGSFPKAKAAGALTSS
jgi:hypothetical protein